MENDMESQLTGSHKHAYDALFQHPVARNLQWRDVWSMLGAVATAVEGNATIALIGERHHLVVPHLRREVRTI